MKKLATKVWSHWSLRPIRAIKIAYDYVFSGQKVQKPYNWSDI